MLRSPLVDTLAQAVSADVDSLVKLASEEQLASRLLLAQQAEPPATASSSPSSSSSSVVVASSSVKKPIASRAAFAEMRALGAALSCDSRLSSGERVGEFLLAQWSQKEQTTTAAKKQKTTPADQQ